MKEATLYKKEALHNSLLWFHSRGTRAEGLAGRAGGEGGLNWPICLFVFIGLTELDSPLSHSREEGALFIRLFRGTDATEYGPRVDGLTKGFIIVTITAKTIT